MHTKINVFTLLKEKGLKYASLLFGTDIFRDKEVHGDKKKVI